MTPPFLVLIAGSLTQLIRLTVRRHATFVRRIRGVAYM